MRGSLFALRRIYTSCGPASQRPLFNPSRPGLPRSLTADLNQSPAGLNTRANPKHPKPDEVPTTRLASEAATARFEQAFVNKRDRFPTGGSPNKDTLGIA